MTPAACVNTEAYEEAGGVYKPTKKEQRSLDFDDSLGTIDKMIFLIGGYFGGYEKRTYSVIGDRISLSIEHTLIEAPTRPSDGYFSTKDEFIAGLRDIHIGEWKK